MWLKDHCQENLQESKCGGGLYSCRRLRHLLPRPNASITKNNAPSCVVSSSYCSCTNINNNIVFSMNHHQKNEGSNKDEKQMEQIVSSRWNPTPEQLMALEEMYRRGVRTPSAEEIKLIAAKLRQFGKIEGKNVFYWFQNHKARERQKRRRQPESTSNKSGNDDDQNQTLKGNDHKGLSSKDLEAEENIYRFITNSKEPASMQRAVITERMSQRKMAKSAAKLMADLSCMASSNSDKLNPINIAAQQKTMSLSTLNFTSFSSSNSNQHEDNIATRVDHQTLELFPLQNNGDHHKNNTDFKEFMMASSNNVTPNQFYEFL